MPLSYRFGLLIFGAALLTLAGLSFAVLGLREERQKFDWVHKVNQVRHWSTLLARSDEPAALAADIADQFGVNIRWVMRNGDMLTTDESMPGIAELSQLTPVAHRFTRTFPPDLSLYHHDSKPYLLHTTPAAAFIYQRPGRLLSWVDHVKFAGGTFAYLAVLFGAVVYLIRRMLNPLGKVAAEMENFARQGVAPAAPAKTTGDEVGSVATSFARLRLRVENLLASKETLLRDVSHEIRSPLTRMRLRLEFINDAAIQKQMAQDIRLIDSLAGELLDRALLDAGSTPPSFSELDLAVQVQASLATFTIGQQHFALTLPTTAVTVRGNERLLQRCLQNLLTNSLKYSQLGPGSIRISIARDGNLARLTVTDQGARLDEEAVAHLFEPFWRPDRSRTMATGGHGLGLTLVASIVQAHGGTVTATSPEGGGLVVNVTLPLA